MSDDTHETIDSRTLLLIVGLIATVLPFWLWIVGILTNGERIQPACSISHYYYFNDWTRNFFVGALFALAALFVAYKGWTESGAKVDAILGLIAMVLAATIALVPARTVDIRDLQCMSTATASSHIHSAAALGLFLLLAIISYCRFTDHTSGEGRLEWKELRNGIYRAMELLMIIVPICILYFSQNPIYTDTIRSPMFFAETLALLCFGFAWLTKSRILFGYTRLAWYTLWHDTGHYALTGGLALLLRKWGRRKCVLCEWLRKLLSI